MKRLVLILVLFSSIEFGFTSNLNDSIISLAASQYDAGLYNEAIKSYNNILSNGFESVEIYYNLGNAYFKMNNLPSAILHYEKAKKLKPNDADINYNLNVANTQIVDNIEDFPELFFKNWWNSFYNMFSANGWAKLTIGFFILTLIFISIYLLSNVRFIKKIFFIFGGLLLLVTLFSFTLSYQKYYYSVEQKEAIVFEATVTIKSSPNANSVDLFVIHEGTKVFISDELDDWYEIRIANGSIGWLQKKSTQLI
ncbi:MAG: tetratricopeptide repeat protein [Bacteroidetes bacterium]|nr:tetratricopeptide repeat protein [Bacteroidota bacterium]